MDIAEVRKRKRPNTRSVEVLLDGDLRVERDGLVRELGRVQREDDRENRRPEAPAVQARLDDLDQQILEATVTFKFRALSRSDFLAMLDRHPPRPSDVEDGLDFNADTLAPELIAASAVDPEMEVSDAEAILNDWEAGTATLLFATALRVQREVRDVPFIRRDSESADSSIGRNSNIAEAEESLTASF